MGKKLVFHALIGLGVLALACLAKLLFLVVVNWLNKVGIVGASWLVFGSWGLAISNIVILTLWLISFLGLLSGWYDRFYSAAKVYMMSFAVILGGLPVVVIFGLISKWLYGSSVWPIGAAFRLLEIGACLPILLVAFGVSIAVIRIMCSPTEAI